MCGMKKDAGTDLSVLKELFQEIRVFDSHSSFHHTKAYHTTKKKMLEGFTYHSFLEAW